MATVRPAPIEDLESLAASQAADRFADALKQIFIPDQFSVDFILEVAGRAHAHSSRLASSRDYQSALYNPPEAEVFPLCLTGLAGVGKSETIKALRRVLPGPIHAISEHALSEHLLVSHWYSSARGKAGGRQQLADFLGGSSKLNQAKLLIECRRRAIHDGVSALILEELQHANTGAGTAKVTDLLLTVANIGVPTYYVANYSLVHRLKDRNNEDKQRLLSDPRVMLPEPPDSATWREYIQECVAVSNYRIVVDVEMLTIELYRWTFGLKRLVVLLLKQAYLEARQAGRYEIQMQDISRAYLSTSYSVNRADVGKLQELAIQPRPGKKRLDLICPFEIPMRTNVIAFAKRDREERYIQKVYESSRTADERASAASDTSTNLQTTADQPKRQKPRPKPTSKELAANFTALLDSTKKPTNPGE
ncbi:transposase [Pseudomonas farsensis]|uniref:Transposase n=1 Tax=Pseudomonas farsensis TaxID=2745492 RepID=A0ABU8QNS9_9PSED